MSPEEKPIADFNRLALVYRWLEYLSFGPFLWNCRVRLLPSIQNRKHALVLGDGDGRFTARLLKANPAIRVTSVDGSAAMVAAQRRAAGIDRDRLFAQVGDVREWKAEESAQFDLIVTHFFLDCLSGEEIRALAGRIGLAVPQDALWLVSEFAIPSGAFGRFVALPVVSLLYLVFGGLTGLRIRALPDYGSALRAAGWTLRRENLLLNGLLTSQLWEREDGRD